MEIRAFGHKRERAGSSHPGEAGPAVWRSGTQRRLGAPYGWPGLLLPPDGGGVIADLLEECGDHGFLVREHERLALLELTAREDVIAERQGPIAAVIVPSDGPV